MKKSKPSPPGGALQGRTNVSPCANESSSCIRLYLGGNFNCVTGKVADRGCVREKSMGRGQDLPPESRPQTGNLWNDQASVPRAEGTSAQWQYQPGGAAQRQWGSCHVRTTHAWTQMGP